MRGVRPSVAGTVRSSALPRHTCRRELLGTEQASEDEHDHHVENGRRSVQECGADGAAQQRAIMKFEAAGQARCAPASTPAALALCAHLPIASSATAATLETTKWRVPFAGTSRTRFIAFGRLALAVPKVRARSISSPRVRRGARYRLSHFQRTASWYTAWIRSTIVFHPNRSTANWRRRARS